MRTPYGGLAMRPPVSVADAASARVGAAGRDAGRLAVLGDQLLDQVVRLARVAGGARADLVAEALAGLLLVEDAEVERLLVERHGDRRVQVVAVVAPGERRGLLLPEVEGVDLVESRAGAVDVDHREAL